MCQGKHGQQRLGGGVIGSRWGCTELSKPAAWLCRMPSQLGVEALVELSWEPQAGSPTIAYHEVRPLGVYMFQSKALKAGTGVP